MTETGYRIQGVTGQMLAARHRGGTGASVVLETHHSAVVLAALDGLGGLRGVQTRTPTLEDVYLDRIRSEHAR